MPVTVFLPLALILMAYYAYYWSHLTSAMIDEVRQERIKRHLDWSVVRRRGLSKSGWRIW